MAVGKETPKQAAERAKALQAIEASEKRIAALVQQSVGANDAKLKKIEAQVKAEEKKQALQDKEVSRLNSLKSMYADIAGDLQSSVTTIKAAAKAQKNMFKATVSVADIEAKIVENAKALNNAKLDGRKSEVQQLKLAQQKLKYDRGALKTIEHMADSTSSLNDELQGAVKGVQSFVGALPGGGMLSKMMGLDKLGEGVEQGLTSAVTAFGKSGSLAAGVSAFSKSLLAAVGPVALIAAAVVGLVMIFKQVAAQAKELAKETGLTYAQSKQLVKEANKQVASGKNQLSLQKDILAVQKESVKEFGALGILTSQQAGDIADIGLAFGYGAEQAGKVNAAFMSMGVSAGDAANAQRDLAAESLKAGVNVGQVTSDISDNAKSTAKFFGGNVKALKAAAIEAAKMGVSLATMVKVSDSLLDFEQSISSQFELQALTGKQMNFDLARQLALEGDIAGATKAVMDQVGSIHDFNKMDVLERKKLAEATGMDVSELQKSLTIKEKMGDLTSDELAHMNALGLSAAEMADMSSEDLQNRLAQQKSSARTAASFAAMKAQLVNALLPAGEALMGAFAMLTPVLKIIGVALKFAFMPLTLAGEAISFLLAGMEKFKGITAAVLTITTLIIAKKKEEAILGAAQFIREGAINALKFVRVALEGQTLTSLIAQGVASAGNLAKTAMEGAMVLGKAIAGLFSSFAAIPFGIGIPLAIAAAGGLFAMFNKATSVGDLGIDPNGGPIVASPNEGGIFQGTKNDGLSMGPSMGTNGGGGGVVNNYYNEPKEKGGGVTMQQVIDAISNIKMLVDGKELSATMRTADSFRRG